MITQEIYTFANHLADIAAEIAIKYFRLPNGEMSKDDESPVTKADREIERIIRDAIEEKFPDHGIIGEEFGTRNENADFQWILDPIDGTSSFIIGRPIFGTLIALTYQKKPVLGIMNQPINDERWVGVNGVGSQFRGQEIKTRQCTDLADAVCCSSSSFHFKNGDELLLEKLTKLTKYQKIGGVIYGGDCYSYATLASGFVDIVIDPGMNVYDYAALVPIVQEAGGVITDWQGNDLDLRSNVQVLACATKELHAKVLEVLNS